MFKYIFYSFNFLLIIQLIKHLNIVKDKEYNYKEKGVLKIFDITNSIKEIIEFIKESIN